MILTPTKTKKAIKEIYNISTLLSDGGTNSKTAKNDIKTYILYMSPYTMNSKGMNLCPKASAGCAAACLFSAGRGKFSNVKSARINKTEFFLSNKAEFLKVLAGEILFQTKKAIKGSYKIAFRLNGTTDQDFVYMLKKYTNLDIEKLPWNVYFYDYTAVLSRAIRYKNSKKYTLTFSRKENNDNDVQKAILEGVNIAAVFNTLPEIWSGIKVIDGDKNDILMLSNKGVILGLKAKGLARKDTSGFVIR